VWHYVTPHLLAYQPFFHPVVASITKFICSTNLSFLVINEGLLPIQWVKQYGQRFMCNSSTPFNISLSKHKYFTILLSRQMFEPNFAFKMTFALQKDIADGDIVTLNVLNTSSTSNNWNDQHPRIYVAKPNMFLKFHFISFANLGFKFNIKQSQCLLLPHAVSPMYEELLPTKGMGLPFTPDCTYVYYVFSLQYIAKLLFYSI
jgi:hypothetical protein